MGELSGERVVGAGATKRKAPQLMVMYLCDKCQSQGVLDAYDGPPSCLGKVGTDEQHPSTFMTSLYIRKTGD